MRGIKLNYDQIDRTAWGMWVVGATPNHNEIRTPHL